MNWRTLLFTPIPFPMIRVRRCLRMLALLIAATSAMAIIGESNTAFPSEEILKRQSDRIQSRIPNLARQVDDIREAVWRQMFRKYGMPNPPRIYYLVIAEGDELVDPSSEILQRFAGHQPVVKKFSEGTRNERGYLYDAATGTPGASFVTREIIWRHNEEVIVVNRDDSHCDTYWLKRLDGKWRVMFERQNWVQ